MRSYKDEGSVNVLEALSRVKNFYQSHGHQVKKFVFDSEAVFKSVERSVNYAECTYTPTDLHNKHIERLVREIKERWRCMRADLPFKLPECLNFEGLLAAAESINCVPNKQTGPSRTAIEIVTGRRPFARPHKFGQAGLCHVRRQDSPDLRAEWSIFLTHDLFHPNSVRVYVPEYRSVVSRKKFRATEGYPDTWNYEKRPEIVPILREEKDAPNVNTKLEKEDELTTLDDIGETPTVDKERVNNTLNKHSMVLRSHLKNIREEPPDKTTNVDQLEDTIVPEAEAVFAGPATTVLPSDRDMQEYLPNRLAFYNRSEPIAENDYPFETFTHQAYCAMVHANRMSVRQALEDENADKRKASADAIEAEIKQLMDIGAFHPIRVEQLSEQERKRIIPSHMFLKEKLLANGDFDRMKARLVAGGNFVDARSVGETNAPTVNPFTVFFMLNVAAQLSLELLTADIKGAYLIPDIVEGS